MTAPPAPAPPVFRLGARTSPLARAQVELVAALLAGRGLSSTFVGVTTTGDTDPRLLTEIGGTGVFANAVRDALRAGRVDVGVHSLKDLPTASEPDLQVIAVPAREDVRDVLVGATLETLPDGARIGTGAPRRAVQLLDWAARTGRRLEVVPIRGNVDTRIDLARRGAVDAVVLAGAGLRRLRHLPPGDGLSHPDNETTEVAGLPAEVLREDLMLPAPGQGALALEVHAGLSAEWRRLVEQLDDPVSRAEVLVERGFLAALEAGCTAPVGARAVVKSVRGTTVDLTLTAVIGRTLLNNLSEPANGVSPIRLDVSGSTSDPAAFGVENARSVLDELRS
jgi:hydroxymethylbilane synthase